MLLRPLSSALPFRVVAALSLAAGAATPPATAQTVRERVSVEVVTVRLTARDASGRRVENLDASDFELTVDGRTVAIETFTRTSSSSEAAPAPSANPRSSVEPASARPPEGEPPVRTLILVDLAGTHPFDRKDACAQLNRFVQASDPANREFLVARFDGKRMRKEMGWTRDSSAASGALQRIGEGSTLNTLETPGTAAGSLCPPGVSSAAWLQIQRDRLHEALLEALAAFPHESGEGRLLLVTAGTTLMRPSDLSTILRCQIRPSEMTRLMASAGDVGAAHAKEIERATFALWSRAVNPSGDAISMSDVVAKAVERDVAIIPVRAESVGRGDFDLSGPAGSLKTALASPPAAGAFRMSPHVASGQALWEVAENTGGEPILVLGKASDRLAEIGGRAAYTLSFRDPTGDHRYHELRLTCRRPGAKIDYRRGYRIPAEDERVLDSVVAGFLQPEGRTDPMHAAVTQAPATDAKQRAATKLVVRYEPPLETGASLERPVEVIAVGEDSEGNRTEPAQWTGSARRGEDADAFQAAMLLNVAPKYAWSVAVRDAPTGLTSFVFVPGPPKP